MTDQLKQVLVDVEREALEAQRRYGDFYSELDALAVLWDKVEELRAEVFVKEEARTAEDEYEEAIQVAAVAARFAGQIRQRIPMEQP